MRNFLKEIKDNLMIFDGAKGTMLYQLGLKNGECPELWNVTHSEVVRYVYNSYKEAGSQVIQTNTLQSNRLKLEEYSLGDRTYELNFEGARLAREVMGEDGYVAASIGPIGRLFQPSGDLTFETAYRTYKEQVKAVADGGADIINFETFFDLADMRAALIAAKETCDLPVICSLAFEENGNTLMGTDPYTAVLVLKSLGADMVGTNCSFGPQQLLEIIKVMSEVGGIYLMAKPNAGLPEIIDGKPIFRDSPEDFVKSAKEFVKYGVRLIGGCCGTTPEFIKKLCIELKDSQAAKIPGKCEQVITSGVRSLNIEQPGILKIGYLHTRKDISLLNDIKNNNFDSIFEKAMELSSDGCNAFYINIDTISSDIFLAKIIDKVQGFVKQPMIIETNNHKALDNALRIYRGKAGVVINNKSQKLTEDLILAARKYGSTLVDESLIKEK